METNCRKRGLGHTFKACDTPPIFDGYSDEFDIPLARVYCVYCLFECWATKGVIAGHFDAATAHVAKMALNVKNTTVAKMA